MKRKIKFNYNGDQERFAIDYFRALIKPWRAEFAEGNWPTTADLLHNLLHRAFIAEGAEPEHIAWLAEDDWNLSP